MSEDWRPFQSAYDRWLLLRSLQDAAADAMWVGRLAELTDTDLRLLSETGYITAHDRSLLASVGRTIGDGR